VAGNREVGEGYAAGKLSISMSLMSCVDKKVFQVFQSIQSIPRLNSIIHPAHSNIAITFNRL